VAFLDISFNGTPRRAFPTDSAAFQGTVLFSERKSPLSTSLGGAIKIGVLDYSIKSVHRERENP
jgi:hypothetical protein